MKITALAGGVGGAKLVDGLACCLPEDSLSVIVNTGDDFEYFGLSISPDLDTVCYTLAGMANETTGWGRNEETWNVLQEIKKIGGPTWFNIGDRDLATHLERTRRLKEGQSLSEVTRILCEGWGIKQSVFPMSDSPVATLINTREKGWLTFQEYFVKFQCLPTMIDYQFKNMDQARLPSKARKALIDADWIIICPSNPFVSIEPIILVEDVLKILKQKRVLAVSPIVGGKALKGPAAKMFEESGIVPSAYEVLKRYQNILNIFVVENGDALEIESQDHWNIIIKETDTIMKNRPGRIRLANKILEMISQNGGNA